MAKDVYTLTAAQVIRLEAAKLAASLGAQASVNKIGDVSERFEFNVSAVDDILKAAGEIADFIENDMVPDRDAANADAAE